MYIYVKIFYKFIDIFYYNPSKFLNSIIIFNLYILKSLKTLLRIVNVCRLISDKNYT